MQKKRPVDLSGLGHLPRKRHHSGTGRPSCQVELVSFLGLGIQCPSTGSVAWQSALPVNSTWMMLGD